MLLVACRKEAKAKWVKSVAAIAQKSFEGGPLMLPRLGLACLYPATLACGLLRAAGLCRKNEAGFRLVLSQDRGEAFYRGGQRGGHWVEVEWEQREGCNGNRIEGQTFHTHLIDFFCGLRRSNEN